MPNWNSASHRGHFCFNSGRKMCVVVPRSSWQGGPLRAPVASPRPGGSSVGPVADPDRPDAQDHFRAAASFGRCITSQEPPGSRHPWPKRLSAPLLDFPRPGRSPPLDLTPTLRGLDAGRAFAPMHHDEGKSAPLDPRSGAHALNQCRTFDPDPTKGYGPLTPIYSGRALSTSSSCVV